MADDHVTRFETPEPVPAGATFQVVEEEWDETGDVPVRIIRQVRVLSASFDWESPWQRASGSSGPDVIRSV